jgi:cytoskeleton protein RodZ
VTVPNEDTRWLVGVGAQLRAARLEQSISLETVAQVTRISRSQLAAIEEGDAAKLPAMAYIRGFVRIYAGYLGVAADCLMPRQESLSTQSPEPEGTESFPPARGVAKRSRRWFAPLAIGTTVLLLAYCYQRIDQPQPPRPAQSPPAVMVAPQKPVLATATTARPATQSPQQATAPPVPEFSTTVPADGAILRLKVNQDCWLNITIDGAFSQQYDLKAGDLIEWKAEESIALDLGNAGGVEAQFNGKTLAPFGESGRVVHIVLKADSVAD